MGAAGVCWISPSSAFVIRLVLVAVFRPTAPRVADFVDRWWVWLPMIAIIVGVARWSLPIGLVLAAVAITIVAFDPRRPALPGQNLNDSPGRSHHLPICLRHLGRYG